MTPAELLAHDKTLPLQLLLSPFPSNPTLVSWARDQALREGHIAWSSHFDASLFQATLPASNHASAPQPLELIQTPKTALADPLRLFRGAELHDAFLRRNVHAARTVNTELDMQLLAAGLPATELYKLGKDYVRKAARLEELVRPENKVEESVMVRVLVERRSKADAAVYTELRTRFMPVGMKWAEAEGELKGVVRQLGGAGKGVKGKAAEDKWLYRLEGEDGRVCLEVPETVIGGEGDYRDMLGALQKGGKYMAAVVFKESLKGAVEARLETQASSLDPEDDVNWQELDEDGNVHTTRMSWEAWQQRAKDFEAKRTGPVEGGDKRLEPLSTVCSGLYRAVQTTQDAHEPVDTDMEDDEGDMDNASNADSADDADAAVNTNNAGNEGPVDNAENGDNTTIVEHAEDPETAMVPQTPEPAAAQETPDIAATVASADNASNEEATPTPAPTSQRGRGQRGRYPGRPRTGRGSRGGRMDRPSRAGTLPRGARRSTARSDTPQQSGDTQSGVDTPSISRRSARTKQTPARLG